MFVIVTEFVCRTLFRSAGQQSLSLTRVYQAYFKDGSNEWISVECMLRNTNWHLDFKRICGFLFLLFCWDILPNVNTLGLEVNLIEFNRLRHLCSI